MSRLADALGINPAPVSRYSAPEAALRRLELPGHADRSFIDLLQLNATSLQEAIRDVDQEGQRLEVAHRRGSAAVEALKAVEEKLAEVRKLQQDSVRRGAAPLTRRDNQKKIDALLREVDRALADAGTEQTRVFDGKTVLQFRREKIELPELSLSALGRVAVGGRMRSLADLRSRGALDLTRSRSREQAGAARALDEAIETVSALREQVESFTRDTLRPRLGDVAEVLAALHESMGINPISSSAEAQAVLKQLRDITLQTTAVAVAVGADGWNRSRVMELLS